MSVILGTTNDGKELIVSSKYGSNDAVMIKIEKDDIDFESYAWVTYYKSNWYSEQDGVFRCFIEKCKKIWKIIWNKDFYYSEIFMGKEDLKMFKEYVNSIGE